MKKRGSSLVSVLLVASLCVILAFTVAGVSISHLGVANRLENAQVARLNAEAAAHQLIGLVCENPKLGTAQGPPGQSLTFDISLNGGSGRATFDPASTGLPACRNNLNSDKSVAGWNRTLPPHSMQIISQGSFRNEVRTLETILTIPAYKFALATTGDLRSNGGLQVLGVDSLDDLSEGIDHIPKDKLKPGHLASNSAKTDSSDPAMDLKADAANPTRITGDALAVGSLRCDPAFVTIEGAPRGGAEPAAIPKLNLENYDPALMKNGYQNLANGNHPSGMNVTSAVRLQGDLSIKGGLHLDDGFVYVDGNVSIEGGIHGKGMLVSTHNVTVHGPATLSASDSVGLAAKGDVSLFGNAANPSQMNNNTFRGVVYTEGDFSAEGLQLVGTVLGNKSGPKGSEMKLHNVNLIHHPGSIDVDWSNGWEPELGSADAYWSAPAAWAAARGRNPDDFTVDKVVFNHHMSPLGNFRYTPEQLRSLNEGGLLPASSSPLLDEIGGEVRTVFAHERGTIQDVVTNYPPGLEAETNGLGGRALGLPEHSELSDNPLLADTPWFRLVQHQVAREQERGDVSPTTTGAQAGENGNNSVWWSKRWEDSGFTDVGLTARGPLQFVAALHTKSGMYFNSPCDYITYVYRNIGLNGWGTGEDHEEQFNGNIDLALKLLADYDANYRNYLVELNNARSILDGNVSLDPNQFIQLQDKMKRVLVREVKL